MTAALLCNGFVAGKSFAVAFFGLWHVVIPLFV